MTKEQSIKISNALKYIWRSELKGDSVENLRKANWYLRRLIPKESE